MEERWKETDREKNTRDAAGGGGGGGGVAGRRERKVGIVWRRNL